MSRRSLLAALAMALTLVAGAGAAHAAGPPPPGSLEVEEHPGAQLPAGLAFVDQDGRAVQLGDYFHEGKPILLVLAYLRCPMLCDLVLHGVVASVARQGLAVGRDFRALTVSFDPDDTPAAAALKQGSLLQALNRPEARAGWPFLVGKRPEIDRLAERLGFPYVHDAKTDEYAHPAVAFVLTPDGRISRYLYGVQFRPLDVRLALDEAAHGRIGGVVDRVLLTCFRYDPASRRYGVYVTGVLRGGAALVLLLVAGGLGLLFWRDRRRGAA
jgi:protein SCO1/2